jgi:tetratricopeptide (TPR) repeat protein
MRQSRSRRRGYICIWGTSHREKITDYEGVVMECPGCAQTARMIGKTMTPYCSVFYIPLFPEGKGEPFLECQSCRGKFHGDVQEIRYQMANRKVELNAEIEKKKQGYAANPSDGELGCEIIALLVAADRADEGLRSAELLAEAHPNNANVHVMLARVHMQMDKLDRTFRVLKQAIAINPTHADAHYLSAVALMNVDPPRIDEALSFAQQAGEYGHPEARDLVQAIEQAKASA